MRIRTIKPPFWSHPVLSRLSDATKLMAIGLLNLADDEGYFHADPRLVRAALRPMDEDSLITHGSLNELSRIGYIELREHPEHGLIGWIVNFTKHQRVNRPSASEIKTYFLSDQSMSDHGAITAGREGKGREEEVEEEGKGKRVNAPTTSATSIHEGMDSMEALGPGPVTFDRQRNWADLSAVAGLIAFEDADREKADACIRAHGFDACMQALQRLRAAGSKLYVSLMAQELLLEGRSEAPSAKGGTTKSEQPRVYSSEELGLVFHEE